MTEKRFKLFEDKETIIDKKDKETYWTFECIQVEKLVDLLNELHDENIELHIQNDFLKDENQHMRDLVNENEQLQERNNRQAKQLGNIYHLIEKQDWKTLKGIIEEFKECEEQLQKEWKCYE